MLKTIALTLTTLLLSFSIHAKPNQVIQPISENAKTRFEIQQYDLAGEDKSQYRIFVAVPRTPAPAGGYPVLYLLDGNNTFPMAVNGYLPVNGDAPLIIAIGYPGDTAYNQEARTRDYTPAAPGEEFAKGGNAEDFFLFINQKLKPWASARYAIDMKRQTLSGHSFGGLFTLYTLFNHTDEFQHYVAASPSIWWGNGIVIPSRAPLLNTKPKSITITVGEFEEKPEPANAAKPEDPQRVKRKAERQQVTKARDLVATLKQQGNNVNFIMFAGKNHGTVIPDAVNTAVMVAGQ